MLVSRPAAARVLLRGHAVRLTIALFGLSLRPCLHGSALAGNARKRLWRRLVLVTGGLAILAFRPPRRADRR